MPGNCVLLLVGREQSIQGRPHCCQYYNSRIVRGDEQAGSVPASQERSWHGYCYIRSQVAVGIGGRWWR